MGQYYKAIFLESDGKTPTKFALAHSVDCGIKLMEHSYIDNPLLNSVLNYLKNNGSSRLVWAGDYADPEDGSEQNLYEMTEGLPEIPYDTTSPHVRFIVNETKRQFVDLWDVPNYTYRIAHPLSLLTAEGNGRGGGDYDGLNSKFVGLWSRDVISVMDEEWENANKLHDMGYVEFEPEFVEDYEITRTFERSCEAFTKMLNDGDCSLLDSSADHIRELVKSLKAALPKKRHPRKTKAAVAR